MFCCKVFDLDVILGEEGEADEIQNFFLAVPFARGLYGQRVPQDTPSETKQRTTARRE